MDILKNLYLLATERLVLYAVEIWYSDNCRMNLKLQKTQRLSMIIITKCYRTVATYTLNLLTGLTPLDIKAKWEAKLANCLFFNNSLNIAETSICNEEIEYKE